MSGVSPERKLRLCVVLIEGWLSTPGCADGRSLRSGLTRGPFARRAWEGNHRELPRLIG